MKKTTVFLSVMIVFFGMAGIDSCQSAKSSTAGKLLKLNLEKGKGYDYEMVMDLDQGIADQEPHISVTTSYTIEIMADDGNTKTIDATYNSFKMNMKMMGMDVDIDSEKPLTVAREDSAEKNPIEMMNRLFRAIKGQKFEMKVNAEGKVLSVEGMDKMAGAIMDSLDLGEEVRKTAVQSFNKQFNSKNISEQFERIFSIFPNKEMKVGESWDKNFEISNPFPGKYNTTYKVKEIEGDMVTLVEKTRIESNSEKIKLSGDQTGELVVDSKSGLVVNANMAHTIEVTTNGLTIEMKGKYRIKGKAR